MLVSIITSLYRTDKYLSDFTKNLEIFCKELSMAKLDFEILVIANEPTEKEKEFANIFSHYSWFKFVTTPKESLYATWNRGVKLAQGEIIGFWNVDDIRFSLAVIEAKELFKQGAELVYFPFFVKKYFKIGLFYIPLFKQKINKQIPQYSVENQILFQQGMLLGPFFMFTKELYKKTGGFDEQLKIVGDFDWSARAVKKANNIIKAKNLAGIFRVDGGGLSSGSNPRRVAENNIVYIRNNAWDKLTTAEDGIIKQYRSNYYLVNGEYKKI